MKKVDKKLIEFVRFARGISSAAAAEILRSMNDEELEIVKKKSAGFKRPERKPRGVVVSKPAKDKATK